MVEAGAVKALDALDVEQIAVGDHAGDGASVAHSDNDFIELRVGERLPAGDADHGCAEAAQVIDAADHLIERDGLRNLVVLVAVGAAQIAEASGDNLRQHGVRCRGQGARHHPQFADFTRGCQPPSARRRSTGNCHLYYSNTKTGVRDQGSGVRKT